jgi:Ni2+-binding GTPase involved in maturation of urease and hydrogenase
MINGKKQLLMFFSGAGGSGKTAVINQVTMMHASEFCRKLLGVPFDRYTMSNCSLNTVRGCTVGPLIDVES